jgi:hypothetical protein
MYHHHFHVEKDLLIHKKQILENISDLTIQRSSNPIPTVALAVVRLYHGRWIIKRVFAVVDRVKYCFFFYRENLCETTTLTHSLSSISSERK